MPSRPPTRLQGPVKGSGEDRQLSAFPSDSENPLRGLPQVQRLLETPAANRLCADFGRPALAEALRNVLDELRGQILAGQLGDAPDAHAIVTRAGEALAARRRCGLRRTINATGIGLHTNLGRAPLAPEAIAAVAEVAAGYSNLEFDLATGRRGSRTQAIEPLLRELTSADAALA